MPDLREFIQDNVPFTPEQQDVFQVFIEELEEICNSLQTAIDGRQDIAENFLEHIDIIEYIIRAAEVINYSALSELALIIYQSIETVLETRRIDLAEKVILWPWVLKNLFDKGRIDADSIDTTQYFIQHIAPEQTEEDIQELCLQLGQLNTAGFVEADKASRPTVATAEALNLAIAEDENPALVQSFLDDLPEKTAEFTTAITQFIEGQAFSDLDIARRIAHTVKGAGNTVGIVGVANLAHHLEDILDMLAKNRTLPDETLSEVLLESADALEVMSETLAENDVLPDEIVNVYQKVLDWANAFDSGDLSTVKSPSEAAQAPLAIAGVSDAMPSAEVPASAVAVIEQPDSETLGEVAPKDQADEAAPAKAASGKSVRVPESVIEQMMRIAGENMIFSGRIQEHANSTKTDLKKLQKQHFQLNLLIAELEQLVFVRGKGMGAKRNKGMQEGDFDPLEMEEYNELHTVTQQIVESAVDSMEMIKASIEENAVLESVVVDQIQLQRENQEQVMQMRMSPVSHFASRFSRAVRQACRLTGKKVDFHLEGENTHVDNNILQQLLDPIMHVLRNAVDHGIEPPEIRAALGKPERGKIVLKFGRVADQIIVSCQDDGGGLDYDKILKKAQQKQLISSEKSHLSDEEIARFILIPGFSTKDDVSQVSGRGIGLDVVNQRIQEIKGSLKINAAADRGTTLTIALPVSLMSTHALLVDFAGKEIAISNHGLEDIVFLEAGAMKTLGDSTLFSWNDEMINVYALSSMLGLPVAEKTADKVAIIVRQADGSYKAVTVPFIKDSRDLVLKPLSKYLPRVDGIAGASILGDGSVTPVIDLSELKLKTVADQYIVNQDSQVVEENYNRLLSAILVVDDSISARRSMANFVRDLGYIAIEAGDGIEAQECLKENHIIMVITDLEMPRMNGIDLTRHIKTREQFKQLPVMMVTSRSTIKHRELAERAGVQEYVTKPFDEDDLAEKLNALIA